MSLSSLYGSTFSGDLPSGRFEFHVGDNLPQLIKDAGVPGSPGVYTFERPDGKEPRVMYIGKAGTWDQVKAGFGVQMLRERIRKTHDDVSAQEFLELRMKKKKWKSVFIAWAAIPQELKPRLPAKIEADLAQAFLEEFKNIPEWNKEF
jgi:hypothetical protein